MQKILGNAKSVRSLLSQKYRIDYYQRDYKWKTEQIRELIEDLTTRFRQNYEKNHERKAVKEYGLYFLGSIIVSEKNSERFIVDGQQRLTSITLLLTHLNRMQQNRPDAERVQLTRLIYSTQFGEKSFNLNVDERNECLEALIGGKSPNPIGQPPSVQNLINRFNDIEEIFPDDLRKDALPYFLDWLIDKVMLVEITAFSGSDAYTIFETMNDRGLSLTPTEMLKGYLLANIEDEQYRTEAEDAWKECVGGLQELGQGEDADCIKAWLRSQYADSIRDRKKGAEPRDFDRQGTEFHRWVRENCDRIGLTGGSEFRSFIEKNFKFYARAYTEARHAADNYTDGLASIFFNAQNSFTLQYPLMLAPLQPNDTEETVRRKMHIVATFVEIVLARRIWNFKAISYSTLQYRAYLIMKRIRGLDIEELRDSLAMLLSPEGAEQDDYEYIDFQTEKSFRLHGTNRPQVHRLLARLTAFLEQRSDKDSSYQKYANPSSRKGGYQIEHIWADHWDRHKDEFPYPNDFADYRNRVGGLVLLPAGNNASYSDMTYAEKLPHYAKENLLAQSLTPIAYEHTPGFRKFRESTGLPFRAKTEFRKADLDERQELYIALAARCWSPDRLNET